MTWMDLLFPPRCVLCGQPIKGKGQVCIPCAADVRTKYQVKENIYVEGCTQVRAAVAYKGRVRHVLLRCKYGQRVSIGRWGGGQVAACLLRNQPEWKPDLVTYVPTTLGHWWKRGFNLSKVLAQETARRVGLSCQSTLRRKWFGRSQLSQQNREERLDNARSNYFPRNSVDLTGQRIVLIDDVLTSGATASVCAEILRKMGAREVYLICLAKTFS